MSGREIEPSLLSLLRFADSCAKKDISFLSSARKLMPNVRSYTHRPESAQSILSLLLKKKYIEDFHSTLIYFLLSHEVGAHRPYLSLFLAFLTKSLGLERFSAERISIEREYQADGRIDLVLLDQAALRAVIVENKIYAADQNRQLPRYHDSLVKKNYVVVAVLYLTLTGKGPDKSTWSAKDSVVPVLNIAYYSADKRNLLDGWITKCTAGDSPVAHLAKEYASIVRSLEKERIMKASFRRFIRFLITNADAQESMAEIIENAGAIDDCLASELHNMLKPLVQAAFPRAEAEETSEGYYLSVPAGERFEYMLYCEDGGLGVGFRCKTQDATKNERAKCLRIIGEGGLSNPLWVAFKEIEKISTRSPQIYRYFSQPSVSEKLIKNMARAVSDFKKAT